jgi:6-phosphogluconolactonase (cycloisomerase 2 family)
MIMLRKLRWLLLCVMVFSVPATVAAAEPNRAANHHVYTLTNDAKENGIAGFRQGDDGHLTQVSDSPFATGGKGLTGGDIDEQGAIQVHGEFLLAVNPGSDTIAVFRKGHEGTLKAVEGSPFPSGGSTPLSLTVHGDLVYVANQAAPFAKPNSAPNITGFRMDKNGTLKPIEHSTMMFEKGHGPAQVAFSPDGKLMAVSAGFQDEDSSRIHCYRVLDDGTLKEGPGSPLTPKGASGTVGFSWDPNGERLYVSNFRGSSIIVFDIDKKTAALNQRGEPYGDMEKAACWTTITADGKTLYVANFVSNSISVFDIGANGTLKLVGTTKRRAGDSPDTKDLELSKDGNYLYAVGSSKREIAVFRIGHDRMLTELPQKQSPVNLGRGQNVTGLVAD